MLAAHGGYLMKGLVTVIVCTLLHLMAWVAMGTILSGCLDFVLPDVFVTEFPYRTFLPYSVWLFMGLYCGLLNYDSAASRAAQPTDAGDWYRQEDSGKTGILVILTAAAVLVVLSIPCFYLWWQFPQDPSIYVPVSFPLSMTFLGTLLAAEIFAHTWVRPALLRDLSTR
jgi:hypothetical protein